ncbi:MAG TPA: AbrB/MazE/SpoVT family DNA-binding domain-containing protein [Dermatophilaceae bacterium]|jgi:AbrB family looped-hinge helix DNA binding protein
MKATIDKAGRLVIPKALRDRLGLVSGDVDVFAEGAGLRIELVTTDHLVERDGHLLLPSGGAPLTDDDVRELRHADQE